MPLFHPFALAIYAVAAVMMVAGYFLARSGWRKTGIVFIGLAVAVVAFRVVFPILFILLLFALAGKSGG